MKPTGITFVDSGPYQGDPLLTDRDTNEVLRYDAGTNLTTPFVPAGSGGLTKPWKAISGPDGDLAEILKLATFAGPTAALKPPHLTNPKGSISSIAAKLRDVTAAHGFARSDVTAALCRRAVSSSWRSHRPTQTEPDETASDDEADAASELPFLAAACHNAAV